MTARQAATGAANRLHSWKDWLVIGSVAVNLLFVGAMYGDMRATLSRTVLDVRDLSARIEEETKTRNAEDNRLEDYFLEVRLPAAPQR